MSQLTERQAQNVANDPAYFTDKINKLVEFLKSTGETVRFDKQKCSNKNAIDILGLDLWGSYYRISNTYAAIIKTRCIYEGIPVKVWEQHYQDKGQESTYHVILNADV